MISEEDLSKIDIYERKLIEAESARAVSFFSDRIKEIFRNLKKRAYRLNLSQRIKEGLIDHILSTGPVIRRVDFFYILEELSSVNGRLDNIEKELRKLKK